jgi:Sulfotransferase domain
MSRPASTRYPFIPIRAGLSGPTWIPGYYHEQILRYLRLFPREQLRLILFEDLLTDPAGLMMGLFEFVSADPIGSRRSRDAGLDV